MSQDKNPVFRKPIIPWYDSDRACWLAALFGILAGIYGIVGLMVALDATGGYTRHLWLPLLLTGLSAILVISVFVRLIRRWRDE